MPEARRRPSPSSAGSRSPRPDKRHTAHTININGTRQGPSTGAGAPDIEPFRLSFQLTTNQLPLILMHRESGRTTGMAKKISDRRSRR